MVSNILHYETVSNQLTTTLKKLMTFDVLQDFHLVGGTNLSLRYGHRISTDIDLFTDIPYVQFDLTNVIECLENEFNIVKKSSIDLIGAGTSLFIGEFSNSLIKLDLYHTDSFVFEKSIIDTIRMVSEKEIAAMKLEVICNTKRKKDFWDVHLLLDYYTIQEIYRFFYLRYPYLEGTVDLSSNLLSFDDADADFTPICLKNKVWELIKLDIYDTIKLLKM